MSTIDPRRLLPVPVLALALLTACAPGGLPSGEPTHTTEVGGQTWRLWVTPDPPRQEGNILWLEVLDESGEPLSDATVTAAASMPPMGAMSEMRASGDVESVDEGIHRIALDLPMGGTWTLDLTVRTDRGTGTAEYSLTPGSRGLTERGASSTVETGRGGDGAATSRSTLEIAEGDVTPAVRESLRTAIGAYEDARGLLADDELDGLSPAAERLARSLEMARAGASAATPVATFLEEARAAAVSLGEATSLEDAREAFGEVSRFLLPFVGASPDLSEGLTVFECPMTETFPKWMQPSEQPANPYMGPSMLTCAGPTDWSSPAPTDFAGVEAHVEQVHGGDVAYYTCAMHPSVRSDQPGTCPICSMDLTPVTREELDTGVIRIDAERRQTIGVRTAPVGIEAVDATIRAVGEVKADETRLSEVTLKNRGWIGQLHVDETGQEVRRGQTLFTLYSPELLAAQEELLTALASQRRARETSAPERADYLVEAVKRRLRLWDLTDRDIERIASTGEPIQYLAIPSPASGYVVEKHVVEGASVEPGETLFRVAGLDRVWVEAQVYESELPLIEPGQRAEVTLPYLPGERFQGEVTFVSPVLRPGTRTGTVRVELPNPELALKPEMYANVTIRVEGADRLVVPEEAVIYAGPRRLVFVDLGEGRLQPREVELGRKVGEHFEVLSGLSPGEVVVTSGNFLIAAESRLKSATEQW